MYEDEWKPNRIFLYQILTTYTLNESARKVLALNINHFYEDERFPPDVLVDFEKKIKDVNVYSLRSRHDLRERKGRIVDANYVIAEYYKKSIVFNDPDMDEKVQAFKVNSITDSGTLLMIELGVNSERLEQAIAVDYYNGNNY